jgi:hypothetical protein
MFLKYLSIFKKALSTVRLLCSFSCAILKLKNEDTLKQHFYSFRIDFV